MACQLFPCCRERKKSNQRGEDTAKSIDDPPSDFEGEVDGYFGLSWALASQPLSDESSDSGSDCEIFEAPVTFERGRSNAVSAEVYGPCNPRTFFHPVSNEKTPVQETTLREALKGSCHFKNLSADDLDIIVDTMAIESRTPNELIFRQGELGRELYVVLSGKVDLYREVVTKTDEPDSTMDNREILRTLEAGDTFGELALLWNSPRSLTACANKSVPPTLGRLDRDVFSNCVIQIEIQQREQRQENLSNVKLLEVMSPEQIAKLAETLEVMTFREGEALISQGEPGRDFFIMIEGECVAVVTTFFLGAPTDEQEHRRYRAGDLFGERALIRGEPRGATIRALTDVKAFRMKRSKFERLLGPLTQIQETQYLKDPRKLISDFYAAGDATGPAGSLQQQANEQRKGAKGETNWFAVYRPTSRDAIAKMLSGAAVGKGLNVKGKSAKKGVLSGFVPFLQISDNADKAAVEESPPDSRVIVYYRNAVSRDTALASLYSTLFDAGGKLKIDDKKIKMVDNYKPDVYGLDVPEPLLTQAYIYSPDIVPTVGWESGRASEPAFMDMNLHALRESTDPKVVLYQFDEGDALNPRGLLIAYAEQHVKPVVSDFDTFTIGSKGMKYEPLPANQTELALWSLVHAEGVLSTSKESGWTSRWLEVLKVEGQKGFHPEFPKYGFGDPTSYRLIGDVVQATIACGAIRHGAECFNFYFPQELDNEYLVIWEGFPDKPWGYKNETQLREFLSERIDDGFVFPLNPVWPVRDRGWYDVLQKMRSTPAGVESLKAWDPPGVGILEKIDAIHAKYPDGFSVDLDLVRTRTTRDMFGHDVIGAEQADLAMLQVRKAQKKWESVRMKLKMTAMLGGPASRSTDHASSPHSKKTFDETQDSAPT